MREMIDWCAAHQFSLLQILPINETADDNSPYNAISSRALDHATIAVNPGSLPDLSPKAFKRLATPGLLRELRQGGVQYRKVKPLKLALLREAFGQFLKKEAAENSPRANEFHEFTRANGDWLADYALFRTLMRRHRNFPVWEEWPAEHRTPSAARAWLADLPPADRHVLEEETRFFSYVQWIAHQQWTALKQHGEERGVFLMGDIPFGIGRCSADVWANPDLFDLRWSCGAPPEPFFKDDLFTQRWGQNWGVPLYRWDRMKQDDYAWWRSRVRACGAIFHFFRIDHVLGFYRVYAFPWQPRENAVYLNLSKDEARARAGDLPRFWPGPDDLPEQKQLNCVHGGNLLRMVMQAAGASGIVGEDLGMVPDYVRPSLAQMGIPGFKIPMFERHTDGSYKDSARYQPLSVATYATHDHEPLAACWTRWQTATEGRTEMEHQLRWIGRDPIRPPPELTPELHAALLQKLLLCPVWLAVFMITDLFGWTQRFNVPGPASESNWTERLGVCVADLDRDPQRRAAIAAIARFLPRK